MAATKCKGRIKQSVSRWCFNKIPFPEFVEACADMGLEAIELLRPEEFAVLKGHNLVCAMTSCGNLQKGLNHTENHEESLTAIREAIEATAAAGFPNVICFSGNRKGMTDEEGLGNCAEGLKRIMPICEKHGVVALPREG